jgi:sulfate transporter 3
MKVMEKMIASHFLDKIGKENVFLSIEEAIETCRFSLQLSRERNDSSPQHSGDAV